VCVILENAVYENVSSYCPGIGQKRTGHEVGPSSFEETKETNFKIGQCLVQLKEMRNIKFCKKTAIIISDVSSFVKTFASNP